MYLTDEQIMLLEQLTYLTDDVADAAGVLLGPYDSVENLLQQFDDDALQRLEDPGNPDSTKPNGQWLKLNTPATTVPVGRANGAVKPLK